MPTYGITGATGQLGRKVIAKLASKVPPEELIAFARDPAKAAHLGVATRSADYAELSGLVQAFEGLHGLLFISSSSMGTRQAEHANVIEAAKRAGVRHIVYTSLLHAERWGIGFADDHLATERWLKESGLDFTILRNGWYWENHTASLAQSLDHGGITSSAGHARISWASRQDYADAAVSVLTQEGHVGKTYELSGDRAYTLADIAAETARQTGRVFCYRALTEAEHAAFYEAAGLPKPLAAMLAEIDARGVAKGVLEGNGNTLSMLIGHPTTTLQDAVAAAIA